MFRNRSDEVMIRSVFMLFVALAIFACQGNFSPEWNNVIENNINDIFVEEVTSDILPLSREMIHAKDLFVYNDSILVVLNNPTAKYCIQVYNIYSGNHISDLIRKGNGPKEMLLCRARIIEDNLYIRDFAKGNYTVINLPCLLKSTENYDVPEFKKYKEKFNIYDFLEVNNRILYLNPLCFEDINNKVDNHEPRLFYEGYTLSRNKFNTFNVSQGTIISNDKYSLIVFASLNTNELEIYNYDLNPLIKVLGPTYFDVKYAYDGNHVSFKDNAYYGYQCIVTAGDTFWATYQGALIDRAKQTYIIQYKWDGTIVRAMHSDKYLSTISLSSKGDKLYLRGKDDDGVVVLYIVNLAK